METAASPLVELSVLVALLALLCCPLNPFMIIVTFSRISSKAPTPHVCLLTDTPLGRRWRCQRHFTHPT